MKQKNNAFTWEILVCCTGIEISCIATWNAPEDIVHLASDSAVTDDISSDCKNAIQTIKGSESPSYLSYVNFGKYQDKLLKC